MHVGRRISKAGPAIMHAGIHATTTAGTPAHTQALPTLLAGYQHKQQPCLNRPLRLVFRLAARSKKAALVGANTVIGL
jgi:hypothetical protein